MTMATKNVKDSQVLTTNLRKTLKAVLEKELEALPETLEKLDPAQRINVVCKLIGYILPKVESINFKQGEPLSFDMDTH